MATLLRTRPRPGPRSHVLCQCSRSFPATNARPISLQLGKNDADAVADTVPPYPYGPARWYKQSRLGLYGGQRIQFGNNVGEKIQVKTRRSWHPNVVRRKLFSQALDRTVQVRVTTRTLRTIEKHGGLDEYLLGEKAARIRELGESGWWLRWAIMQTPAVRKRFAEERARLGIPEEAAEQPEVELAEATHVIEDGAGEESAEAAAEIGEAVGTDGAFHVEQPADLPQLVFRVGPAKHLVLTSKGWVRTRPSPARLATREKEKALQRQMQHYEVPKANYLARVEQTLKKQQQASKGGEKLNIIERGRVLEAARRAWNREKRAEMLARVEETAAKKLERKERKKEERRAAKKAPQNQEEV